MVEFMFEVPQRVPVPMTSEPQQLQPMSWKKLTDPRPLNHGHNPKPRLTQKPSYDFTISHSRHHQFLTHARPLGFRSNPLTATSAQDAAINP